MKTAGALTETEVKEARQLFRRLELINSRKDTMTQILQNIVDRQALYLESGDLKSLLPFSQKELAKKIGIAPISVSRAIRDKSIDTPGVKKSHLNTSSPDRRNLGRSYSGSFLKLIRSFPLTRQSGPSSGRNLAWQSPGAR